MGPRSRRLLPQFLFLALQSAALSVCFLAVGSTAAASVSCAADGSCGGGAQGLTATQLEHEAQNTPNERDRLSDDELSGSTAKDQNRFSERFEAVGTWSRGRPNHAADHAAWRALYDYFEMGSITWADSVPQEDIACCASDSAFPEPAFVGCNCREDPCHCSRSVVCRADRADGGRNNATARLRIVGVNLDGTCMARKPFPAHVFGGFAELVRLESSNVLTGALPAALGDALPLSLEVLMLNQNFLHGPVPASIARLRNLRDVQLFEQQAYATPGDMAGIPGGQRCERSYRVKWEGFDKDTPRDWNCGGLTSLPESMRGMPHLEKLWLDENHLAGPLPAWLAELPALGYLDLFGNKYHGPLPDAWKGMRAMRRLQIGGNLDGTPASPTGAVAGSSDGAGTDPVRGGVRDTPEHILEVADAMPRLEFLHLRDVHTDHVRLAALLEQRGFQQILENGNGMASWHSPDLLPDKEEGDDDNRLEFVLDLAPGVVLESVAAMEERTTPWVRHMVAHGQRASTPPLRTDGKMQEEREEEEEEREEEEEEDDE